MKNEWYWCSRDLEPDYVNCRNCPSGCNPETCQHRHAFHDNAVRWCDDKRRVKGLPLTADDFDWMKENFRRKELVEKQRETEEYEISLSERMKREAENNRPPQFIKGDMTLQMALGGICACFVLGFPMAYIGQLFQLFTMFIFDMLGIFISSGPHSEVWSESYQDSFLYADFSSRYLYWTSLMIAALSWINYNPKYEAGKIERNLRIGGTLLFLIVTLMNFNLFISSIVGPLFLIVGLFITAKRR